MNTRPVVERLAALPDLAGVPRDQLEWLVEHGEFQRLDDGAVLRGNDDLTGLVLLVSGRFSVRVNQHSVVREVREITPGRVTGYLPYSRMTTPRGYLVADGPVELLMIPMDDLREMTRECYEFTGLCVQEMLARVRLFKSEDKQQEKMAALGRLSAGLAHELNNPASAVVRGAGELDTSRRELVSTARALESAGIDELSPGILESLEAAAEHARAEPLTPVDRAGLEDDLIEWLESRNLDASLAYPFLETCVTVADLDAAASALEPGHVATLVRYVAAVATSRSLAAHILSASTRIHTLVAAVKKHTHMDRAPAIEPIRLDEHLADTVTLLRSKASLKGVALNLTVEDGLSPVQGSVADLNQVWMHLIDNAIDAVAATGHITIDARCEDDGVVVRVVDDGPGIPVSDQERVFEPFFTTKDVSQGRGLGLDIVRTVVRAHRGSVDLRSEPGRTEFRVTLPADGVPS